MTVDKIPTNFTGSDIPLYIDAESYDTFDLKSLYDTLTEEKVRSFNYLYDAQKDLVAYQRFDLKMSNLRKGKVGPAYTGTTKYIGTVSGSFISNTRRLAFKRSRFYNKELSLTDTMTSPEIFTHTYLIFIGGKFYDNIKLLCSEDKTFIIFDTHPSAANSIPTDHFNTLVENDSDITVYFVPNCNYGIYQTNRHVLLKYKDNLALKRFNLIDNLDTEPRYITFVNDNDFLFTGVIVDTVNSADMLRFTNENMDDFESRYIHLNIFGFRDLLEQVEISGENKFFTIPRQDMPIPVENIMFFRNIDGKKFFAHDIQAKMYYPNFYEIINNTNNDDITAYLFYFNDKSSIGKQRYRNVIDLYASVFPLTTDDYENDNVPPMIRGYVPDELEYNIEDFRKYVNYPHHLHYKLDKLRGWIKDDPTVFKTYLIKQIEDSATFYLDCSGIDLPSKYRLNNHNEAMYDNDKVTFDEPHYVFILRRYNDISDINYRFFVDGIMTFPKYMCKDNFFEFYYIPVTSVNPTSIIEIERFGLYSYDENIIFTESEQEKALTFESATSLYANHIFVINTQTKEFIPRNSYKISCDINGYRVQIDENSNKKLPNTFQITLTDPELVGMELTLFVREHYLVTTKCIDEEDAGINHLELFTFNSNIYDDRNYIRLFKNGRLIPNNLNIFDFSEDLDGGSSIITSFDKEVGDCFGLDYTPYKYTTVYTSLTIPNNGFIDLKGLITRPFDFRWYDVYLNGRKLNKSHIDIITPTIIFIQNVESIKNFTIIQKGRGSEYLEFNSSIDLTFEDMMWNTIPELRNALTDDRPILDDIEIDILERIGDIIGIQMTSFFVAMGNINKYINPDFNQIPDKMSRAFPDLFTNGNILHLNPDDRIPADSTLDIIPVSE